jgi:WD40 repeat protein
MAARNVSETQGNPASEGPDGYDVFLSYRRHDADAVEHIAEGLVRAGLRPWLDRWSLTPGGAWQYELGEALDRVGACAVFVGPSDVAQWEREEAALAVDRAVKDPRFRVFAVLLPGVQDPFDPNCLPHFLRTRTWVDFRRGPGSTDALQHLVNAVKGVPFGRPSPPTASDTCPYRGLQVFDREHADFFFGREADVQRLLEKLKGNGFLAIVGPSGSGKSSLMRAALLPALADGALEGSERWEAAILRPGANPLGELAAALLTISPGGAMQRTLDELSTDRRTLDLSTRLALSGRRPTDRVVVCIDQFEEAFTLCHDEAQRQQFFDNIVEAGSAFDRRTLVLATLRADFYPRLAEYPELAQLVSAHQFVVGPLSPDGLRRAIEEPVRRVGLAFESGLVDTILDDVGSEPGSLPLLEHALLELWNRRRGRLLTLEGYRETGGVHEALARRADDIFARFEADRRETARRLFLRLTEPGEGAEDTRRRVPVSELVADGRHGAVVNEVLEELASARLLTVSTDSATGEPLVEVSHEALIRSWGRLRAWIEEDREGFRIHRRLTRAAEEWDSGRDESVLYRGSRLAVSAEWADAHEADLNERERRFLAASRAGERRELAAERRRKVLSVFALTGLTAAIAMGILAIAALQQRSVAREQRTIARSRELAASAVNVLPVDPQRSVRQAREALDLAPTAEAEAALRQALPEMHLRAVLRGHTEGAFLSTDRPSAFTPDGRQFATRSDDGTAAIWDIAAHRRMHRLLGNGQPLSSVTFSTDGKLVLTAGTDGVARIWRTNSGQLLRELRGHEQALRGASFSPDSSLVVTAGGGDHTARIWAVASGRVLQRLSHPDVVASTAFSPSGEEVLTSGWDARARIWDVRTGAVLQTLRDGRANLSGALYSPDGSLIVTTSWDGTARVWASSTGNVVADLQSEQGEPIDNASFSSNGQLLVTTSGTSAELWDAASGQRIATFTHSDWVESAAFSSDGTLVVTASNDHTARVWSTTTGRQLRELRGQADAVTSALFTADGKRVVTAGEDGTVRIWDLDLGTILHGHTDWVLKTAFSPDGRRLATASEDGTVRVWDARTGAPIRTVEPHGGPVSSVAFSADGRSLVIGVGIERGAAQIWDAQTGALLATFPLGRHWANGAAVSPDGRWLAAARDDRVIRMWNTRTHAERPPLLAHTGQVTDVSFSPDGNLLVSASLDGTARVWEVETGRVVRVLRGFHSDVHSASFSPDGRLIVTTSADRTARLWAVSSGHLVRQLSGHTAAVYDAAFTPDGRFVVTGSSDSTTRIWSVSSGTMLAVLHLHAESVNGVAVTNGLRIASASDDGTASIYQCQTCRSIEALRRLATRYLERILPEPARG